jgi:class 3 adenylate cyclase
MSTAQENLNTALRAEVDKLHEQLDALSRVLRALVGSAALQSVLDEVVEACTRLCNADAGALWLLQGDELHYLAYYGDAPNQPYDRDHPHPLDRKTAAGRTAVTRQPTHIPDVTLDPEYEYGGVAHYRSMLGVPIVIDEELIGVAVVVRFAVAPFTDEDMVLAQTFSDQAAIAIANARLLETVERQRAELSRFLSPQVAELISSSEGKQLLAGHRAYLTIAYFDLRGFTAFAETAEPEELINIVREYHTVAGELVNEHDGTLEHFAGDGLMVFFNDPVPIDEPELQAAKLALGMRERVGECAKGWRKRGYELGLGAGIAVGYATLGRIGFEGRYDYGALGSVTNVAARLSDEADAGQILLSQRAYAALEDEVDARKLGSLELKGLGRAMKVYELVGLRNRSATH